MRIPANNTISIDGDSGPSVQSGTQYGIRFPDGTTAWGVITNTSLSIEALLEPDNPGHNTHRDGWDRYVLERAKAAKIDAGYLMDQHRFMKRTIILATTETEMI